jgi:hypothetical protein
LIRRLIARICSRIPSAAFDLAPFSSRFAGK